MTACLFLSGHPKGARPDSSAAPTRRDRHDIQNHFPPVWVRASLPRRNVPGTLKLLPRNLRQGVSVLCSNRKMLATAICAYCLQLRIFGLD